MSLRDFSGSSSTSTPAARSNGRVSSKMRPFDSAIVIIYTSSPYAVSAKRYVIDSDPKAAESAQSLHPLNVRTQAAQLGLHLIVTPIQMINALHRGLSVCHQAGNHQAGGGPQISRHNTGAGELFYPFNQRHLAVNLDVGAQPHQLIDVHETVLENSFRHFGGPVGNRV